MRGDCGIMAKELRTHQVTVFLCQSYHNRIFYCGQRPAMVEAVSVSSQLWTGKTIAGFCDSYGKGFEVKRAWQRDAS